MWPFNETHHADHQLVLFCDEHSAWHMLQETPECSLHVAFLVTLLPVNRYRERISRKGTSEYDGSLRKVRRLECPDTNLIYIPSLKQQPK